MAKISIIYPSEFLNAEAIISQYELTNKMLDSTFQEMMNNNDYSLLEDFNFQSPSTVRDMMAKELEQQFTFVLLTILESWFRVDFIERILTKSHADTTLLTKKFKAIYSQAVKNNKSLKHYQISLKDDILTNWRLYKPSRSGHTDFINLYIESLNFRNWFAHGRYWKLPERYEKIDFEEVKNIVIGIQGFVGQYFRAAQSSPGARHKDDNDTLLFSKLN